MSRIILIFLIAAPFIPCFCYGDTLTVDDDAPADYTTIQDAINDALDGDTVEVAEGHYLENIDFRGKAITITGTDPCDPCTVADTIIDANGDGIVVSFHSEEEPNSVITGFTITGGYAKYGAGICCWGDCSPTVIKCNIIENNGSAYGSGNGGGIFGGNGIIKDCLIANNTNFYGAAIDDFKGSIINCEITNNTAGYRGGGLHNCQGEINGCLISPEF